MMKSPYVYSTWNVKKVDDVSPWKDMLGLARLGHLGI